MGPAERMVATLRRPLRNTLGAAQEKNDLVTVRAL